MMHPIHMRTTINLDDDIHRVASLYADARGISLGEAVGELIRKAQTSTIAAGSAIGTAKHGLPVFRSRGRVLTSKMVREAQEDDA
jgi:hypothetical protein